jgi:hypothetical protein
VIPTLSIQQEIWCELLDGLVKNLLSQADSRCTEVFGRNAGCVEKCHREQLVLRCDDGLFLCNWSHFCKNKDH